MKNNQWIASFSLTFGLLAIPASANASDWSWTLTLYGWATDVSVDSEVDDREVVAGRVDFADLIDDADFAAMLHLEGRRERFGLFADLIVTDFGDEPRIYEAGRLTIQAESDLEMTILELGGAWYPGGADSGFGLHFGARMIDVDQEIDLREVGPFSPDRRIVDVGTTLIDGLLGFRYHSGFASSWSLAIWGDVAAGGTELSWSAGTVLGYRFGARDQFEARLGYRHLSIELEDEDRMAEVETEIALTGPVLAFSYSF